MEQERSLELEGSQRVLAPVPWTHMKMSSGETEPPSQCRTQQLMWYLWSKSCHRQRLPSPAGCHSTLGTQLGIYLTESNGILCSWFTYLVTSSMEDFCFSCAHLRPSSQTIPFSFPCISILVCFPSLYTIYLNIHHRVNTLPSRIKGLFST